MGSGHVTLDAVTTVRGAVTVLRRDDVDTDQIVPKQFLKRVERTGFGRFLFYDWAKGPGWSLPANPILVTGRNFGCGSSREQAAWALQDYGFRALIAPSFGDIFYSNCTKIGLLPVTLADADVHEVMRAPEVEIDLDLQEVRWDGRSAHFEVDPRIRSNLLNGVDDVAVTLGRLDQIEAYEARRALQTPLTDGLRGLE
jgi:3-isopropylmalate/(R)-2-methylmalate dehydratase small subunit